MVARLEGRLAGQSERLLVLPEVLVVLQLAELRAAQPEESSAV